MAQQQYIKHLYEKEEKSFAEIARTTNLNYRTVRKYALKDDWSEDKLPNLEPESYPVLGEFIPTINEWLEKDKLVPRKQRHTGKRIYYRLCDEFGYTGSYSSVKKYLRKKKAQMSTKPNGYLPLAHPPGEAQLDFGEFIYYDARGQEHKAYTLVMSFPYSNKAYIQVFPAQNQECLLEGMKRIFEYIGGVPSRIRFDNMSTAVAQVLEGAERKLTDGFTRFMLHYRFEADFCNPASGNEKGNVENKVEYIRERFFVPVPSAPSLGALNDDLALWCREDMRRPHYAKERLIADLFVDERAVLLPLRPSFEYWETVPARTDKRGFVSFRNNKYFVGPVKAVHNYSFH